MHDVSAISMNSATARNGAAMTAKPNHIRPGIRNGHHTALPAFLQSHWIMVGAVIGSTILDGLMTGMRLSFADNQDFRLRGLQRQ